MSTGDVLKELLAQRKDAQSKLYAMSTNAVSSVSIHDLAETIKSLDKAITSICNHSEYDKEYDEDIHD
jgi:hypothetical protein